MEVDRVDARANMTGIGSTLLDLMRDAGRRHTMRGALATMAPPDSAEQVAEFLIRGREFRGWSAATSH
jgi:hypothetical protein